MDFSAGRLTRDQNSCIGAELEYWFGAKRKTVLTKRAGKDISL
jgi:hypothetical protein